MNSYEVAVFSLEEVMAAVENDICRKHPQSEVDNAKLAVVVDKGTGLSAFAVYAGPHSSLNRIEASKKAQEALEQKLERV